MQAFLKERRKLLLESFFRLKSFVKYCVEMTSSKDRKEKRFWGISRSPWRKPNILCFISTAVSSYDLVSSNCVVSKLHVSFCGCVIDSQCMTMIKDSCFSVFFFHCSAVSIESMKFYCVNASLSTYIYHAMTSKQSSGLINHERLRARFRTFHVCSFRMSEFRLNAFYRRSGISNCFQLIIHRSDVECSSTCCCCCAINVSTMSLTTRTCPSNERIFPQG